MNGLFTADYVLGAVTLVSGVLGIFGGFSGALGFCAGVAAAGATVKFGYAPVARMATSDWAAMLGTLIAALFAFGIVRTLVRRVVKGLLAQPADAIFGFIVAAATGAGLSLAATLAAGRVGGFQIESAVFREVMSHVGG